MPFDEEEEQVEQPPKVSLKKVSSQRSIFDSMEKKPTAKDLSNAVKKIEENNVGYKKSAAELTVAYKKAIMDKTLAQNRNVFMKETEQELLANMIKLAIDINTDQYEKEGMGSLMWIQLLLKTCLAQRDKINALEYELTQIKNKTEPASLKTIISQEIRAELDKNKVSE